MDEHTPLNDHIVARQGERLAVGELPKIAGFAACKLLKTRLARHVRFDPALRSGEDVDFMDRYFLLDDSPVHVLPTARGAVYRRLLRTGSVSRQPASHQFSVVERIAVMSRVAAREAEHDERTRPVLDVALSGQTGHAMRYLREQPSARAEVVALADEAGLPDRVLQRLNQGFGRTLVCAVRFPPHPHPSGVSAAQWLLALGVPYDVVQMSPPPDDPLDPALAALTRPLLDGRTVVPVSRTPDSWAAVEVYCRRGLGALARRDKPTDGQLLLSVGPWPAAHLLAALVRLARPGLHWQARPAPPEPGGSDPTSDGGDPAVPADPARVPGDGEVMSVLGPALRRRGEEPSRDLRALAAQVIRLLADEVVVDDLPGTSR